MKRSNPFKYVLSLCLAAMCWTTMTAAGNALRGDVTNDGNVDITDVTSLIDYLSGVRAIDLNLEAADVDDDGSVGISDVTALVDYLLIGEWPYVPEPLVFTVGNVTFKMMPVKGGTFMMGARDNDPYVRPWESPAHEVTLSDYYIGETEVTQALWRAVMSSNPSWFSSANGYANNLQRPVEKITYANCVSFITKLNQKTGKTFRLVTEAEWEFAARGGNRSKGYMYSGSDDLEEVGWHKGNSDDITHPVASKAPNELGIYDMSGNVEEWCSDWYGLYTYKPATNPIGPSSGDARIVRGGCWDQAFRMSRVTARHEGFPTSPNVHTGLRIAMTW